MRLCTTDGSAFAWLSSHSLVEYLGRQLTVEDSAGKQAIGYIKEADAGEALGADLFDAGAGIFTDGTYSWTAYGTNTIANDANTLKITYADSQFGAKLNFNNAADFTTDLTVGKLYKFNFAAKRNTGILNVIIDSLGGTVEFIIPITGTTFDTYTQYFTSRHATSGRMFANLMTAGEILWLDNLSIEEVTHVGEDGVHIVSASGGATRNWTSIDTGFNPNDPAHVTVY